VVKTSSRECLLIVISISDSFFRLDNLSMLAQTPFGLWASGVQGQFGRQKGRLPICSL